MKKLMILVSVACLLFFASGVVIALAAVSRQPTNTARFQCDVVYDSGGNVISVPIQVFFRNKAMVDDAQPLRNTGANDWYGPVTVDLMAAPVSSTNYTAAGKTNSGIQLAAGLNAVFNAEQVRQNVP